MTVTETVTAVAAVAAANRHTNGAVGELSPTALTFTYSNAKTTYSAVLPKVSI